MDKEIEKAFQDLKESLSSNLPEKEKKIALAALTIAKGIYDNFVWLCRK